MGLPRQLTAAADAGVIKAAASGAVGGRMTRRASEGRGSGFGTRAQRTGRASGTATSAVSAGHHFVACRVGAAAWSAGLQLVGTRAAMEGATPAIEVRAGECAGRAEERRPRRRRLRPAWRERCCCGRFSRGRDWEVGLGLGRRDQSGAASRWAAGGIRGGGPARGMCVQQRACCRSRSR